MVKSSGGRQGPAAQTGLYLGTGLQFATTIVVGTLGGWWLDEKLSTSPLLLIAGMLFGASAAFYHLYKTLTGTETSDAAKGPSSLESEETNVKGE